MEQTCFVIMPIGTQTYDGFNYEADDLKRKYDDLIRDCIQKARPNIIVTRADDVSSPGSITNDIFMRLMYSDFVVADISLPNPNVFYELGLRHAIRTKTILIKDKAIKTNVFDISHLRHIDYENNASGLKTFTKDLEKTFQWLEDNPNRVDNQFLDIALLTKFQFIKFIDPEEENRKKQLAVFNMITPFLKYPELMKTLIDPKIPQEEKNKMVLDTVKNDPDLFLETMKTLVLTGMIKSEKT